MMENNLFSNQLSSEEYEQELYDFFKNLAIKYSNKVVSTNSK